MLYKAGPIQPVCQAGDMVGIWASNVWIFGKVTLVEGIPYGSPLMYNLGAIAAGASTAPAQLTNLAMNDYEFGQWRMRVLDDFAAELSLGRANKRYSTKTVNSKVTLFTNLMDKYSSQTEFFVNEDNYAFVAGYNETAYALSISRVAFWGFRYAYELQPQYFIGQSGKASNVPTYYTRIPASAF
jgi:hypothetical protein